MKKYINLDNNEPLELTDEVRHLYGEGWGPNTSTVRRLDCEYRRPVPFTGKQAFLVTYAPTIRVVVDCDGLSEEELDLAVALAAEKKFRSNTLDYLDGFQENIDWESTKPDLECPYSPSKDLFAEYDNYLPFGCNPETEFGRGDWWVVSDYGNMGERFQIQRVDEPVDHDPLDSDEEAWELATMAGYELDENGFVTKFPEGRKISAATWPQYRPFVEGDIIEEGDQVEHKAQWWPFSSAAYGEVIESDLIHCSRKLIRHA